MILYTNTFYSLKVENISCICSGSM